jgi:hypothetical protein
VFVGTGNNYDPNGAIDVGPAAVACVLVSVGFMAGSATAPTMLAGATIGGRECILGPGYTHLGIPGYTGDNKFYAFAKQGRTNAVKDPWPAQGNGSQRAF